MLVFIHMFFSLSFWLLSDVSVSGVCGTGVCGSQSTGRGDAITRKTERVRVPIIGEPPSINWLSIFGRVSRQ